MPEKETVRRARKDKRRGKAPSTQAGEFVREEIHHVREGKHGARSAKQAIAIGLSKARRAGVKLPPPRRAQAARATRRALRSETHRSASGLAVARLARTAARGRPGAARKAAARRAARTRRRTA
jgi:hypothetical protein